MKPISKLLLPACCVGFLALAAPGDGGGRGGMGGGMGGMGGSLSERKLGTAKFMIDKDAKTLMVISDEETDAVISRLLEQIDRPVPQVLIKVVFVEVSHEDGLDLGTEFSYKHTRQDGTTTTGSTDLGVAGMKNWGMVNILNDDLDVTLAALGTVTRSEVLSRPSVMTRNNEQATITVGEEVPFVRNTQTLNDGRIMNTIEYDDIGIIMKVTPRIDADGMVEMAVDPEISYVKEETVEITEGVKAPTFGKRAASTKVIVPSGKTMVIGGLMDTQDTVTEKKVPWLGDIPYLGYLFKYSSTTKTKKELLIFLTPIVVDTASAADSLAQREHDEAAMISKSAADGNLKFDPLGKPATPEPKKDPAAPAPVPAPAAPDAVAPKTNP